MSNTETYFKLLIIIYMFRINKKFKDYLSCSKQYLTISHPVRITEKLLYTVHLKRIYLHPDNCYFICFICCTFACLLESHTQKFRRQVARYECNCAWACAIRYFGLNLVWRSKSGKLDLYRSQCILACILHVFSSERL